MGRYEVSGPTGFGCQVSEEKDRFLNSEVGMRNAEKIEVGIWNVASGP